MTAGTTRIQTCPQLASAPGDGTAITLAARVDAVVRRAWQAYWKRRARRATVLILCSLDRRTLRDMGIHPSELESCVYGKGDRLRRYHDTWPWRSRG